MYFSAPFWLFRTVEVCQFWEINESVSLISTSVKLVLNTIKSFWYSNITPLNMCTIRKMFSSKRNKNHLHILTLSFDFEECRDKRWQITRALHRFRILLFLHFHSLSNRFWNFNWKKIRSLLSYTIMVCAFPNAWVQRVIRFYCLPTPSNFLFLSLSPLFKTMPEDFFCTYVSSSLSPNFQVTFKLIINNSNTFIGKLAISIFEEWCKRLTFPAGTKSFLFLSSFQNEFEKRLTSGKIEKMCVCVEARKFKRKGDGREEIRAQCNMKSTSPSSYHHVK